MRDETLWYARPREILGEITFVKVVALMILGALGVGVCVGIVRLIPHPYAGWGLAILLVASIPASCMRMRVWVIGAMALVTVGVVGWLHVRATHEFEIDNQSGRDIAELRLQVVEDAGAEVQVGVVPAGSAAKFSILLPGYRGRGVWVSGKLSDGREFSAGKMGPLLDMQKDTNGGETMVMVKADGQVEISTP